MADQKTVAKLVRIHSSIERVSRCCLTCAMTLLLTIPMGCVGGTEKRVAGGPTWPWQNSAKPEAKPSPFREPKSSGPKADAIARPDGVNQYGFDRETWEFVQAELHDATPAERDEMLGHLKELEPAMIRVALHTWRLTKNLTDSRAKSRMQLADRQDDFDDGHRFGPPPRQSNQRDPRDSARNHSGQIQQVGAVNLQPQGGTGHNLQRPSATLTGVQQQTQNPLLSPTLPGELAALDRLRLERSAGDNSSRPEVSSQDAWPNGSLAGVGPGNDPTMPPNYASAQARRIQTGPSLDSLQSQPIAAYPNQQNPLGENLDRIGMLSPPVAHNNPMSQIPNNGAVSIGAQFPPTQNSQGFDGRTQQVSPIAPNGVAANNEQYSQTGVNQNRVQNAAAYIDHTAEPWQQELGRMIALLEASTAGPQAGMNQLSAQQRELMVRKHLYLRMLYVMSGQGTQALATSQIPHIDDKEREFWRQLFWAMHQYFDAQTLPNRTDRITQTLNQLRYAVQELQPRAHLELRNVNFCNSIASFGNFESFPRNEFPAGEEVLIYAEVVNFTSEIAGERFHSRLQPTVEIYQAGNDQTPAKSMEYAATPDYCSNPRQDFYLSIKLAIPKGLAQGPHVLKLIVKDVLGNKVATYPLRFTVR